MTAAGFADVKCHVRHAKPTLVAIFLAAIACNPPEPQMPTPAHILAFDECVQLVQQIKSASASLSTLQQARRCAFSHDSIQRVRMQTTATPELTRQARVVMDIPEFHDEQRLPADASPYLGPLVGIYTSPFLGSFRREWQVGEHPLGGVLAAHIVVDSQHGDVLPNSYTRMNLAFGLNCLFLELNPPGAAERFKAWILQPQKGEPCRPHHGTPGLPGGPPLKVIASSIDWPQDSMVAASRIEEDAQGRAVFGVPCLDKWCRVGLPGFALATNGFCTWGVVSCTRKEERIAAWYDEQQWDEFRNGRWQTINLRVAIVPRPQIDGIPAPGFDTRRHMADLYLREDPPAGSTLWAKGVRRGHNTVELEGPAAGGGQWRYIITAASGGVTSIPFHLAGGRPHRHFDAAIPGTTRFRYTMLDPGIWGPCGQACCPTDGT